MLLGHYCETAPGVSAYQCAVHLASYQRKLPALFAALVKLSCQVLERGVGQGFGREMCQ